MSSRFVVLPFAALSLAAAFAASGCAGLDPEESDLGVTMSAADAALLLDFVNYPGTDLAVLDDAVGLDRRAAESIVARRNGADGVAPSADDAPFQNLAQLDAVPYVGDVAFEKLRLAALQDPAPSAESVETILFAGWESEAVVWGVGHADVVELDVAVGLDARAAQNLVAARPFASVTAMGPLAYVGTAALQALRAYADVWWAQMRDDAAAPALAGTFDSVAFDEATARTALEIANLATSVQLVAHGLYPTGASRIVAWRPYPGLAAVAAVEGVGTATMTALRAYAQSGQWVAPSPTPTDPPPPAECTLDLRARTDADAADFTRLLALATTGDYPYAEVLTLQANACYDLSDGAARDFVLEEVLPAVDWRYALADALPYISAEDFSAGSGDFVTRTDVARTAILERVLDGSWSPSTPDEQALYGRLDALHAALTAAPRATPSAYWGTLIHLEASECSQDAAVLVDPSTMFVWVLHRLPGC